MMETTRQLLERLERSLQAARNADKWERTGNLEWHKRGLNGGLDIAIRAVQDELKWLPAEEPKNDTDEG